MSYTPQGRPCPPPPPAVAEQQQPQQRESYEKPKPKDPRTFIGWALKAFIS